MLNHLSEDWPWIVVPIAVVAAAAAIVLFLFGGDDSAVFTYAV